MAYAFALAGNQERRTEVLTSLYEEAVKEGESTPENFLPSHILGIKNSTPKVSHDYLSGSLSLSSLTISLYLHFVYFLIFGHTMQYVGS